MKEQLATTTTGTGVWEAARANLSVDMLICIDAHYGSSDSAGLLSLTWPDVAALSPFRSSRIFCSQLLVRLDEIAMLVVVALAICVLLGIVGRGSRIGRYGWIGAGIAALTLVVVAWAYHDDAQSLRDFVRQRDDLVTQLRTNKICLDMETNPGRWSGMHLEYPCLGYGATELKYRIAEQEESLRDWNQTIDNRRALLRARETGQFSFVQKEFGDPYE